MASGGHRNSSSNCNSSGSSAGARAETGMEGTESAGAYVCYCIPVFRAYELLLIAYFAYTSLLAAMLPVSAEIRQTMVLLNTSILSVYFLLAYADSFRHT